MKMLGEKSIIFDVDLYVGWGTPAEFHEFDRIAHFHKHRKLADIGINGREATLWDTYLRGMR
ncbi:MAG: hypothetical protein ABIH41_02245, partial [Nanoarchaeota archaeon]